MFLHLVSLLCRASALFQQVCANPGKFWAILGKMWVSNSGTITKPPFDNFDCAANFAPMALISFVNLLIK